MKEKRKYLLGTAGVVAGCLCLVNSYIGHWKDVGQKAPEHLTPAATESWEVPDYTEEKEQHRLLFSAPLGPEITMQVYDNFTLYMEGTGVTWDFASQEKLLEHLAQYGKGTNNVLEFVSSEDGESGAVMLHGTAGKKQELSVPQISELVSLVKEIVVEDGTEYLGSYVLSLYPFVSEVNLPNSVVLLSDYTFQGIGSAVKEETVWNGANPLGMEHGETTFEDAAGIIEVTEEEWEEQQRFLKMQEFQEKMSEECLVYRVPVGDTVYELYDSGVLYVAGSGSTGDYESETVVMGILMQELGLQNWKELEELWYHKVTSLYIGAGVTRIGDWALSRYSHVTGVFFEQTPESFGRYALCRLGAAEEDRVNWNGFTLENGVAYEATTFKFVVNPPEKSGKAKEETR